jgi:tetratricopeptide (TPR) repeat protein
MKMARPSVNFLFLAFALLSSSLAAATEIDHAVRYRTCMALARSSPEDGFETALSWRGLGGGDAAEHCAAMSLMGLKQYKEAAERFEDLAQKIKAEPLFKAKILAHAAQALVMDNQAENAESLLSAAIKLDSQNVGILIDRANVRGSLGAYEDALNDLNRAAAMNPNRAEIFVFRATAERFLGNLDKAEADIENALSLDAYNPEGWLERGILYRISENNDAARKAWMRLLSIAPQTEAAVAARANLERMDVRIEPQAQP